MVDIVRADSPPRDDSVAATYDAVPYGSLAFAQTHPDRLATIARIFGLAPPDVTRCRVLELGCASGGNLIPIAFNVPGSRCVGVDLSRRQVEDGRATIQALGMPNITIEHASILDVDRTWGEFDYIICHGVFSWVEAPVQDKILEIARDQLAPDGVEYISYNTYPGWHMREMVRHMMRYHSGQFDEPKEQIEQARALLTFLASVSPESGVFGQLLGSEAERLRKASDWYLYHEQLEQANTPLYFHQFSERAERFGLQYLSEATVSDMLTSVFPASIAETLERISPDILHLEQYMDFVRNREFRQTLLCHKALRPQRALTPAFMHDLFVSSSAVAEAVGPDLSAGTTMVFRKGKQTATATLPASKAALTILIEHWPEAIAVDALCAAALERAAPYLANTPVVEARRYLMGDLLGCVMYGVVGLHTQPPPCVKSISETPRAHPLAAWQASRGAPAVNAHHEMFQFEPLSIEVLKLADGQRRRRDIVEALVEGFETGALTVEQDGKPITEVDTARAILAERTDRALASLARSGVLISERA